LPRKLKISGSSGKKRILITTKIVQKCGGGVKTDKRI
jgi:hypothetical protein